MISITSRAHSPWSRMAGAVLSLSVVLACLNAAPAFSQTLCGPAGTLHKRLAEEYNEAPIMRGLDSKGPIMVLYASEAGSFTVVYIHPNGLACITAAGEHLEPITPKVSYLPIVASHLGHTLGRADHSAGDLARPASFLYYDTETRE